MSDRLIEAYSDGTDLMLTFSQRDYGVAPGRFGIDLLLPRDAIERIRR